MTELEVALTNLLQEAISLQASDIHFDISKTFVKVQLRKHKQLLIVYDLDKALELFEHLRFISGFDLSRSTIPQSGSFSYFVQDQFYDFRFASLQTLHRKHGVLRILNMNAIESLEASVPIKAKRTRILKMLKQANGIIVFSGKTGSGKSTTLFNASKTLIDKVVFSLENPIERHYEHCVQLEVSETLSFETALTQLLRHDPDVIILGELRSEEDIKQCIRCGLSGHLVLTTLHAGSIQHVLNRMYDLGASPYDLSHVLKGIVHQEMSVSAKGVLVKYTIVSETEVAEFLKEASNETKNCASLGLS